ncbi:hypothetical protein [Bacillus sp. FJAT-47783]|uniref:hypothetical protein n=1 Tax=Bacillus sp. FJAT-47783 TaxID=2922712 RepID=UPI001FAC9B8F|nr:hypothetical protein [Bacillus sp. FJAT-47783]
MAHENGKRLYREQSNDPIFVMKTPLDPKSPLDQNPYAEKIAQDEIKKEELEEFFDDGAN